MEKGLKWAVLLLLILAIVLLLVIHSLGLQTDESDPQGSTVIDSQAGQERIDTPEGSGTKGEEQGTGEKQNVTDINLPDEFTGFPIDLQYQQYPISYEYVVVLREFVNVREGPSTNSQIIRAAWRYEKLDYLESVWTQNAVETGENGITESIPWIHVSWLEQGEKRFGFVHPNIVEKREFQFELMGERLDRLDHEAAIGSLTYIRNYKDLKGRAPAWNGQNLDGFGTRRYQSAPGYETPSKSSSFRYLTDGMLVRYIGKEGSFVKVNSLEDAKDYFVPEQYVPGLPNMTVPCKAIIIDRKNQNEAVFEKLNGQWVLISYTLATTGTTSAYKQETPLGYFYGIETRERFYFYKDGTSNIQGYAPYALRFSGGAYIHGVPVNYVFRDGNRIDPGMQEISRTLGTIPLSHKCVRNYTSHAKFLYDWFEPDKTVVIVIE